MGVTVWVPQGVAKVEGRPGTGNTASITKGAAVPPGATQGTEHSPESLGIGMC